MVAAVQSESTSVFTPNASIFVLQDEVRFYEHHNCNNFYSSCVQRYILLPLGVKTLNVQILLKFVFKKLYSDS